MYMKVIMFMITEMHMRAAHRISASVAHASNVYASVECVNLSASIPLTMLLLVFVFFYVVFFYKYIFRWM